MFLSASLPVVGDPMTITAALAAFFRRPGIWAYLTRRAELTYLRERDTLLHSERMAVIERLKPGEVMTESGSGCYRRIWMAPKPRDPAAANRAVANVAFKRIDFLIAEPVKRIIGRAILIAG